MARLDNVLMKIFGSAAGTDQIAKFGSLLAGSPAFTTDPAQAQSLSNWLTGWFGAAIGGNSPAIEDMNSVLFAICYQLAYYQQSGVPEWNSGKSYYIGSLVNDGAGAIYVSVTDDNVGNAVTDAANWTKVAGKVMTTLGDFLYGGTDGALTRLGGNTTTTMQVLTQTGTGSGSAAPVLRDFKPPTVQKFTSGSGTYTTPDGVMYIEVEMVGGGGGGGGGGSSGGTVAGSGGNTTFGTSLLVANGGVAGTWASIPGAGGSASLGTGPVGVAIAGGGGGGYFGEGTLGATGGSPAGGASAFGGAGKGADFNAVGGTAAANSGSGGGGGGSGNAAFNFTGSSGGSGGYVCAIISGATLAATFAYAVGAGGTAGGAGPGGQAGGAGAAGIIIVREYYQ